MSPTLRSLAVTTPALWFSRSFAMSLHPNILNPQSNATCLPDYAWMNNAEGISPCLTVAYVIAACVGDTWVQPALPPNSYYDPPSGTTATPCYCSWSCYNLMMGCTLCQNQSYTNEMMTWPAFSQNCPSNYIDDVFPPNYVIANNVSIAYWATIDPKTWLNALFNIEQAQTLASQNHSDYNPSNSGSTSSSSSSGNNTNVGVIIGSTVGGAIGLLLVLIGAFFLYKRKQYKRIYTPVHTQTFGTPNNTHARHPSYPSMILSPALSGMTLPPPPIPYTIMQPNSSAGTGMMTTITPPMYPSLQPASDVSLMNLNAASFYTTGKTAPQQRNPATPIV